jgi:hypothetical protein
MPNGIQNNAFSNAQFTSSDLLKFIQEKGSKTLWTVVSGLDSVTKKAEWPGGKEVRYHLTVDPGAMAFGGLNAQAGTFMPADRAYGIQGFMVPKYQTFTMYFDKILGKLSDSDAKAYLSHVKMEYEQKIAFQKSFMNLQQTMDGTGRVATPVGVGTANASTGTALVASPSSLFRVKLSSADTAVGGAPYLMEGMIVSFLFPNYDTANDGTVNVSRTDCAANFVNFGFVADGGAGTEEHFDAFRVVRINQSSNEVYLAPARRSATTGVYAVGTVTPYISTWDSSHHVQQGASANIWCAGAGAVTVTPYVGRGLDLGAPTIYTALDLNDIFVAGLTNGGTVAAQPVAVQLVLTGYLPTGTTASAAGNTDFSAYTNTTYSLAQTGRRILGLQWDANVDPLYTASTDVSLINPYLMTGMDSLLFNDTNMVQGIPRYSVQQILPTKKNWNAQPLTFNSLFSGIAEHVTRNREKTANSSDITQWNLLTMNPLVYTSLLSLSEADRRITDEKGIRGTSAKYINYGAKKFELDQASWMRMDRVIGLPKDAIQMYGGTIDPVEAGGQKEFLSLVGGRRTNAVESYNSITSECCIENLRSCFVGHNFQFSSL